jgi:hypothetical protein
MSFCYSIRDNAFREPKQSIKMVYHCCNSLLRYAAVLVFLEVLQPNRL